ncbi:MAG: Ig-like domain-containing protein [candidate division KSB1 bacterium]|nr:Ig-like domain-containing protein [candidate division KSB1 bacterium]MDZ7301080.1 Ig-like domain-containing protein [candidate division KSB1 bacterium]MDZ7312096.1 Ig-like domain-containing protein [candidate division KSB1 bacterium]
MHRLSIVIALLIALSSLLGCEELGNLVQPNKAPIIDRVYAVRNQLSPTDTTTVIVEARDPEGGVLSYEWSAEKGTLASTTGRSVLWTAPAAGGNYQISVKVRDEKKGETQGSITLTVLAIEKPTVKIIYPTNGAFIPGLGTIIIEVLASHPNGIQRVEFQVGANFLGMDNSPPYQQPWSVEGLSGPATIIARAYRAGTPGEPGVDSVRVSVEGVTRL